MWWLNGNGTGQYTLSLHFCLIVEVVITNYVILHLQCFACSPCHAIYCSVSATHTLTLCDVTWSWGRPEAREKWSWSTFCKFIFNTSKGFSQGYCTGQLLRSNYPCDLHMTWLWPLASGCPVSWNRASHECGDWLVSNRLHISATKIVEEMKLLPCFSRVVYQSLWESASLQSCSYYQSTLLNV